MEIEIILSRLKKENKRLESNKEDIIKKRNTELELIEKEIEKNQIVIDFFTNDKYICPSCKGTGEERYCDAAGDMDSRQCSNCNGTGVVLPNSI